MAESTWTPPQTLDPANVKCIITTRWAGTSYKAATLKTVESYNISSHLDSDADPWTLEVGNLDGELNAVLARDNEVRVKVFGAGSKGNVPLLTGIMDDVNYTEQGTLQLSGRDMSMLATDSTHFPNIYRGINVIKIIEMEARQLGMTQKFAMKPIKGGPKRSETDGSETYWEFWYRLVRKDGRFIWMTPDGTLNSDDLQYNVAPKYSFASQSVAKKSDIPVMNFTWHKTAQTRVGTIGVEWRTQDVAISGKPTVTLGFDKTIKDWKKKPQKLVQDKHAISNKSAAKIAFQEIYESRVGAVEIILTVADPGYLILSNKVAHVNLPEYGLKGNWFVVGSTIRGDTGGFLQDVRLRERHFAISKRVPDAPEWTKDPANTSGGGTSGLPTGKAAKAIFGQMGEHGEEWWPCFVNAAQKWRGKYDLALYIATLLAICDHETGFTNERSNDENDGSGNTISAPGQHNVEWYDIRKQSPSPAELDNWKTNFANQGGDGYVRWSCAVGPMQLFDTSLKQEADTLTGGGVNEFFGDRWKPCNNIMVAAHKLNSASPTQNGSQTDLWAGVCRYGGYSPGCAYGQDIRNRVLNDPGWLQLVQEALGSVPPEGAPGSSPPPQGTGANQYAKRLQLYHQQGKFHDDNGRIMSQVNKVANGDPWTNGCGETIWCDGRTLAVVCWLIENGYNIGLFALCEDHSCYVSGSSTKSAHALGRALDISSIGIPSLGWYNLNRVDPTGTRIAIQVMELLKDGGWLLPSQIICNGVGTDQKEVAIHQWNDGPTDYITGDHTNHMHVGYRG
jgi:prophage tail gpP-like protein